MRCLKPNSEMKPDKFEGAQVLTQLTFSGMTIALKVMRHGYPSRLVLYCRQKWKQKKDERNGMAIVNYKMNGVNLGSEGMNRMCPTLSRSYPESIGIFMGRKKSKSIQQGP